MSSSISFSSAGIIRLVLSLLLLSCSVTALRRANPITGTGQLRRAAAGEGSQAASAFPRRHYTFASITATGENRGVIPSFINRTDDDAKTNAQSRSTGTSTKKLSDDDTPLVRWVEKFSFGSHV